MMRVLAFAALVGAVKAGLTSDGKACDPDTTSRVVSDLCRVPGIAAKVAEEAAAREACTAPTCTLVPGTDCSTDGAGAATGCTYTAPTPATWTAHTWDSVASTCSDTNFNDEPTCVARGICNAGDTTAINWEQAACEALFLVEEACAAPTCTLVPGTDCSTDGNGAATGCIYTPPVCTAADCSCWNCETDPAVGMLVSMTADNDATETELAGQLTVMTAAAETACSAACGLGDPNGPVAITTVDFELPSDDTVLGSDGNWCGEWRDRQQTATCKTSIFDAKGLLFLIIIGGALAIIFFQCSIMAVVAAVSGSKKDGDAKP